MRLASSQLVVLNALLNAVLAANETASLARKRRSLTFPKGSAFVLTVTLLKAIQLRMPTNWNLDLEFDMIWPIPEGVNALVHRPHSPHSPHSPHRRHRRQLYANLELALDSQGLPGQQCVLRTICEARFILNPVGVSLVEDLLRVIFSYPSGGPSTRLIDIYDNASSTRTECHIAYPCPLSLLDMLLSYQNDVSTY